MPAWLLRILPQLAIALALLGALWAIDHRGYRRAMADRDARDAAMLVRLQSELRRSEQRLANRLDAIDADYAARSAAIGRARTIIQPVLTREIHDAPRLADPALGLTPGLLAAVNRARATGACAPAPDGGIACALPAAAPGD